MADGSAIVIVLVSHVVVFVSHVVVAARVVSAGIIGGAGRGSQALTCVDATAHGLDLFVEQVTDPVHEVHTGHLVGVGFRPVDDTVQPAAGGVAGEVTGCLHLRQVGQHLRCPLRGDILEVILTNGFAQHQAEEADLCRVVEGVVLSEHIVGELLRAADDIDRSGIGFRRQVIEAVDEAGQVLRAIPEADVPRVAQHTVGGIRYHDGRHTAVVIHDVGRVVDGTVTAGAATGHEDLFRRHEVGVNPVEDGPGVVVAVEVDIDGVGIESFCAVGYIVRRFQITAEHITTAVRQEDGVIVQHRVGFVGVIEQAEPVKIHFVVGHIVLRGEAADLRAGQRIPAGTPALKVDHDLVGHDVGRPHEEAVIATVLAHRFAVQAVGVAAGLDLRPLAHRQFHRHRLLGTHRLVGHVIVGRVIVLRHHHCTEYEQQKQQTQSHKFHHGSFSLHR